MALTDIIALSEYHHTCSDIVRAWSKKKPRYLKISLGTRGMSPVKGAYPRSIGGFTSRDECVKWNTSDLLCLRTKPMDLAKSNTC